MIDIYLFLSLNEPKAKNVYQDVDDIKNIK